MTSRPALLLSSFLASLLLAGCGSSGGSDPIIGHETKDDAMQQAMNAMSNEVNDPESPVYHDRLRMVGATPGRAPSGDRAWRVEIADATRGKHLCVYAWLRSLGIATSSHTDITLCGQPPANAS